MRGGVNEEYRHGTKHARIGLGRFAVRRA